MRKIIVLIQLLWLPFLSYGQQYPYFSQFFLNPYLYNPATIGNSGVNELNFTYRQQWLGINDAPITQAFNFQFPTKKSLSFGINFYNDKAVLLNTSSLTLGIAYQATLSENHYIKFGISTGVGMNNFDLNEVDNPDDPALRNVLDKSSFLTGQFGVFYYLKGLKLGFSMPQMYKYSAIDTVDFQVITLDQLDNYIFTASYKFHLGASRVGLEPFALYRKNELLPVTIEAGAMLDYNDLFWVGGSYRKDYGGTGYVGFNLKRNISFAYAYEFAGGQQVSLGNGSHELNFKIKFGKNKRQQQPKQVAMQSTPANGAAGPEPVIQPYIVAIPPVSESSNQNSEVATIEPEPQVEEAYEITEFQELNSDDIETTPVAEELEDTDFVDPNFNKPKPPFAPGHYVVLGAFEIYENAITYQESLSKRGIQVGLSYLEERGLYYIYNQKSASEESARKMMNQYRKLPDFKDAWVYSAE
jgi:type IX secretion system PorP/SprF family membrane protein